MEFISQHFDGNTFDVELDGARLGKQLHRVYSVVKQGRWLTLNEIATITGDPESSISARLRDLRKSKFGANEINRRRRGGGGQYEYRFVIKEGEPQLLF